ncbi:unnamed protein product, partial [Brassica oleracea var. botrytis]
WIHFSQAAPIDSLEMVMWFLYLYLLRFLILCFNVGSELVGFLSLLFLVGVVDWETIVIDTNSEISPISCCNVCQMNK